MATTGTLRIKIDARGAQQGASVFGQASDSIVRDSRRAAKSVDGVDREMEQFERTGQRVKNALIGVGAGIAAAFGGRAIFGILTEYETGLVGVGKTSDLAGKELAGLGSEILQLSTKIPASRRELLSIAQAAGQLGVSGAENIVKFTETVARLGSASDLAGDEGATALARLLNITGEAVQEVDRIASVLVRLGNESAATEREIAFVANQVAAATAAFGTSAQQAAALGAVYASLGIRAELAGSATGRAFRAMDAAIRKQSEELTALAELTGRTEDEIGRIFNRDAVAGFQLFVEGLGRVVERGDDVTKVLAGFGLEGEELLKVLPTLAKNSELVANKVGTAADEYERNTAAVKESEAAAQTLSSRLRLLGNTLGVAVIQKMGESTGSVSAFVDTITESISFLFGLTDSVERVGAAAQVTAASVQFLATTIGLVLATRFIVWLGRATVAMLSFNAAVQKNPIGLLITALAIVVSSVSTFISHMARSSESVERLKEKTEDLISVSSSLKELRISRERAEEAGDVERAFAKLRAEIELLKEQADKLAASDKPFVKFEDLIDLTPDVSDDLGRTIVTELVDQAKAAGGVNIGDLVRTTDFSNMFEPIEGSFTEAIAKAAASADPELAKLVQRFEGKGTEAIRALQSVWSVPLESLDVSKILASLKLVRVDSGKVLEAVEKRIDALGPELEKMGEGVRIKFRTEGGEETESEIIKIRRLQHELSAQYRLERELVGKDADQIEAITAKRRAEAQAIKRGIQDREWILKLVQFEIDLLQKLRQTQARKEAREDLDAYLKELAESNRLLKIEIEQGREAREIEEGRLEAAGILGKAKLELSADETKAIQNLIAENQRLRKVLDDQTEALEKRAKILKKEEESIPAITQLRASLGLELDLVGKTSMERRILIAIRNSNSDAIKKEANAVNELSQAILREEKALDIAKGISDAFGNALDQFLEGTVNAKGALESFARQVQSTLQRELVIEPLQKELTDLLQDLASSFLKALSGNGGFLSGIFGSSGTYRGAVFHDGKTVPFGRGDILNFPTFFPLPGNKTGVMGERGTEAIVPLVVTRDGPGIRDVDTGRVYPVARDSRGNLGLREPRQEVRPLNRAEPVRATQPAIVNRTGSQSIDNRKQSFTFHFHGVKDTNDGLKRTSRQLRKRVASFARGV